MNNESISVSTNNERASDLVNEEVSLINPTFITKSEKLPDPPIFNKIRKNLRPFITKFYFKLSINQDRYSTKNNKVNYKISRLDENIARIINPFFRNRIFTTFENFVSFLKRIYDNTYREHTATTKFKNLR